MRVDLTTETVLKSYIMSANILLVKLCHMTKNSINGTVYAWYSSDRIVAEDVKRGRDDNFEMVIQTYHGIQDICLPILETGKQTQEVWQLSHDCLA